MLYKALIRPVLTAACPILVYAADIHLLMVQCLRATVVRAIGKPGRHTLIHGMHLPLKIPYVYEYITKSCKM
jgi:hypothetical protein